jgi:hypothetical protein
MSAISRLPILAALAAFLAALAGCAGLDPLRPLDPGLKSAVLAHCRDPFPERGGRYIHAIETIMPGGAVATAIGVMTTDPAANRFRTTLMTVEGMVLFDVEAAENGTIVHRAVPPFDAPAFAGGLAEDIRLAFFQPGAEPAAWGAGDGGEEVCRFGLADGRIEEVRTGADKSVRILLYGAGQELLKKVEMAPKKGAGPADLLEIRGGRWPGGYTLRLRLLESEFLPDDPAGPGKATQEGLKAP